MASDPEDALVYLSVAVQGVELSAQVTHVEVEDNDRLIDRAVIVLDDPVGAVSDVPREGQSVSIELGWQTEYAVLFEGEIVRVLTEGYGPASRRVMLVAFDPSYRMMQGAPKTRDHTGPLSSIIKSIAGEHSLPVGQIELDPDPQFSTERPLRQTNKKDWAFLQDLAQRYRARMFVEYNEGASKFYAVSEKQLLQGDTVGTLTYIDGPGQLVEFRYHRLAASAVAQSTAVTVDPETGKVVTASPPAPSPPEPPPAADSGRRERLDALGGGFGDDYGRAIDEAGKATNTPDKQRPKAVVAGLPSDPTLPDHLSLVDPTRLLGLHGEGLTVGSVKLRAKGKVGIQGVANWAEGDWYLRQVTHIMSTKTYWTRFVVTR